MVTGTYTVIRTAEPDDAAALQRVYDPDRPRACLLDPRRELLVPTYDELQEVLSQKDLARGVFHAVEDRAGVPRGFCSLRAVNPETAAGEAVLMLLEDDAYAGPLAEEALEFLAGQAFERLQLNKIVAHALDSETAWRALLTRHGFVSEGVQRAVLYTLGRYHHLETLARFRARGG